MSADDTFSAGLDAWLSSVSGEDAYVVVRTLRDAGLERTELVRRVDAEGGATSPLLVRKAFREDAGRGGAYEQLLAARLGGRRLEHAPEVFECRHEENRLEVVCEYVPGVSLRELARDGGSFGPSLASEVFPELCDAVTELHTAFVPPLIHRDIKPSNIIVGKGRVTLIDFGIARAFVPGGARDTVRYGTPGYAPPEQFGYGQTSVASDVYALGMTLAFCFVGEDPTPALRESGFADVRIPRALRPVLLRATAFDPAERYASAAELKEAFLRAVKEGLWAGVKRVVQGVPAWIGLVWNGVLLSAWGVITCAVVANIVNPLPAAAIFPRWFVAMEFLLGAFVPDTLITLALLDCRRLRMRYRLPSPGLGLRIFIVVTVTLLCWIPTILVYMRLS